MLYIAINEAGKAIAAETDPKLFPEGTKWINRNDIRDAEHASELAFDLHLETSKVFLWVDNGRSCHPRFDVIKAMEVGDKVSYAFNGDSYPCGSIIAISPSYKVITVTDGFKFYRKGETGAWKKNRTWSLIPGTVYKQNPSF